MQRLKLLLTIYSCLHPLVGYVFILIESSLVYFTVGPNDSDNSNDGKNAKIEEASIPDSDYYIVVRTFYPDGGEFNLSVGPV